MQKKVWEKEYAEGRLMSDDTMPQASVRDFLRWLKRGKKFSLEGIRAADFGCGTGKNSNYIAGLDTENRVIGIDISEKALEKARQRRDTLVEQKSLVPGQVTYINANIGGPLTAPADFLEKFSGNFSDDSFDLALDVTASNSLTERERGIFIGEVQRILRPGGYFFVRTLCKDADKNAQELLKLHPGKEHDTYILPEMGLTERVFSRQDFIDTYSPHFTILRLEKETHYSRFAATTGTRLYKRNFWLAYLQKSQNSTK